ncbi:PorT family protein [Hymenobacter aquaticus]|uniref:PorT family protein n=1 Tax=Hymenobacter aquaticus TaxID=1867101 RepID=A0A4Z0PZC5_9BACT|nr:outer membrane beta-barrel protein [Hymenobacter aquaticus]TGE22253.1 PorT family protein [Hymenobacter aquaticus]
MPRKLLHLSCALVSALGALILLPATAQAQTGRQPGYIVPLAGDTVRGTLVLGRAQRNALLCEFQAAGQAAAKQYQPAELRGYGTAGLVYAAYQVPRSADSVTTARKSVFLELLVPGPLQLYSLKEESKERFFIGTQPTEQLMELKQRKTSVQRAGKQFVITERMYQDTLVRVLRACPEQAARAKDVLFNAPDLTRVITNYNQCVAPQLPKQSTPTAKRNTIGFGLVLGTSLADQMVLGEGKGESELAWKYQGKRYLMGGVDISLTPGFKGAPFSVHSGLLYERGRTFTAHDVFFPTLSKAQDAIIELDYLVLPLLARYRLGQGVFRVYAEAGPLFRFLTATRQNQVVYTSTNPQAAPIVFPLIANPSAVSVGVGAGLGTEVMIPGGRPLSVSIRGEKSTGPDNQGNSSTYTNVSLLLGYSLTK